MPATYIDTIKPDMLRWAFGRAGVSEEEAVSLFPQLAQWLSGEKLPTLRLLKQFAEKFFVPFGYLFLEHEPEERLPFPMFRGSLGQHDHFNLNVYDTVLSVMRKQEWLEDYLIENEIDTCKFVGISNIDNPVHTTVALLHQHLELESRWAFSLANTETAVNTLSQKLEDKGVFLAYNGVVGNNNHRKIDVNECRGFALVNNVAPYIFINSTDSKTAQLFTLIHEAAHIMLGTSAGHAGSEVLNGDERTERYCDLVAAEFLVPASELRQIWVGDTKSASHRFKVSELVIARRAHDLGLMSNEQYQAFWAMYSQRTPPQKKGSGGDFYLTSVKRVGRTFAVHVKNAVNSNQLSYTEAYRLTGLYGNTYQRFMNEKI